MKKRVYFKKYKMKRQKLTFLVWRELGFFRALFPSNDPFCCNLILSWETLRIELDRHQLKRKQLKAGANLILIKRRCKPYQSNLLII